MSRSLLAEIESLERAVGDEVVFDKKKDSASGWKYIKHDQMDNGWVALFQRRSSYRPYIVRFEASEYMPSNNQFRAQFKGTREDYKELESAEKSYAYWKSKIESLSTHSKRASEGLKNYLKGFAQVHTDQKYKDFYEWQLSVAKPVHIFSYKDDPEIKKMVEEFLEEYEPRKKACYSNAFYLTQMFPKIEYVTGLAQSLIPIDHGWNCYKGKHFDITAEVLFGGKHFGKEYLQIIKMKSSEVRRWVSELDEIDSFISHYYLKTQRK